MSAFMVDKEHIAFLVEAGRNYGLHWTHPDNGRLQEVKRTADKTELTDLGQMLWDENLRSIQARYPDTAPSDAPGKIIDSPYEYTHTHLFRRIDPVQVLKSCNRYEYQACEHVGWESSPAAYYIGALHAQAVAALPGYSDMPAFPEPESSNVKRLI